MDVGLADRIDCESWVAEDIPPDHLLYMRVLSKHVESDSGTLVVGSVAFTNHWNDPETKGMSTDWCHYANPRKTRKGSPERVASEFGVVSLLVRTVRDSIPHQSVVHTPVCSDPEDPKNPNNRAHTDVRGPKGKDETKALPGGRALSTEIRNRFQAEVEWVIRPDDPVAEEDEQ